MILKSSFIDSKDHIDWIEPIIIDQTRNKQHTYEVDLNELSTFIATFLLYGHFFKWEVHKKYKFHIFSLISLYRSYSSFVIYQNIHPSVSFILPLISVSLPTTEFSVSTRTWLDFMTGSWFQRATK